MFFGFVFGFIMVLITSGGADFNAPKDQLIIKYKIDTDEGDFKLSKSRSTKELNRIKAVLKNTNIKMNF